MSLVELLLLIMTHSGEVATSLLIDLMVASCSDAQVAVVVLAACAELTVSTDSVAAKTAEHDESFMVGSGDTRRLGGVGKLGE